MQNQKSDTQQTDEARVVADLQRQLRELRRGDPALVASVYLFKTAEDLRWQIDYESKKYGGKPRGPQPTPGSVSKDRPVASTYSTYRQAKAGLVPDRTGQFSSGTAGRPREERASAPHVLGGQAGSYLAGRVNEAARDEKPDGSVSQDAMLISRLFTEIDALKAANATYQKEDAEKDKAIAHLKEKVRSMQEEVRVQTELAVQARAEADKMREILSTAHAEFGAKTKEAAKAFAEMQACLSQVQNARDATARELDEARIRAKNRKRTILHLSVIGRPGGSDAAKEAKAWFHELISPGLEKYDASEREKIKECLWSEACSYGMLSETEGLYQAGAAITSPLKVENVPDNLDKAGLLAILQTAGIPPERFTKYIPAISNAMHRLVACKPLHRWVRDLDLFGNGYITGQARKFAHQLTLINPPETAAASV